MFVRVNYWIKRNWRVLSMVQTMPLVVPDYGSAAQACLKILRSWSVGMRLSMAM